VRRVRIMQLTRLRICIPTRNNNNNSKSRSGRSNKKRLSGPLRTRLTGRGDYKQVKQVIANEMRAIAPQLKSMVKAGLNQAGGSLGAYAGSKLGSASAGRRIGQSLAGRISRLVGSGDYSTNTTAVNSLMKGGSSTTALASFGPSSGGIRIQHREYITDLYAGAVSAFSIIETLPVNPGLASTFQYLAQIAQNFEQYIFHGLVFEYVSTTSPYLAGGAMGSLVMAMEYDSALAAFTSKPQMENSDFAVSARPDSSIMYGVECKDQPMNGLYVRGSGSLTNQPVNLTDIGTMYVGSQNTNITAGTSLGELWVTYDVELRKPHIAPARWGYYTNSGVTTANTQILILAKGTEVAQGSMAGTYTQNGTIYFPNATLGDTYMFSYTDVYGALSTVSSYPANTPTGFSNFLVLNNFTNGSIQAPSQTGAITSNYMNTYYYTVSNVTSTPSMSFSSLGAGTSVTHTYQWNIVNLGNGLVAASY
jgi:hypothetical protein